MGFHYYILYIIIIAFIVFLLEMGKVFPFTHRKFFVYFWYEVYSVFKSFEKHGVNVELWPSSAKNFLGLIRVPIGFLLALPLIDNFTELPFKLLDYLFFTFLGSYVFLVWSFCLVIEDGGFDEFE